MLSLLHFLIVDEQQKLREAISRLEPFPNLPQFTELRSVQNQLKSSTGSFTLSQVSLQSQVCPRTHRHAGSSQEILPPGGGPLPVSHFL